MEFHILYALPFLACNFLFFFYINTQIFSKSMTEINNHNDTISRCVRFCNVGRVFWSSFRPCCPPPFFNNSFAEVQTRSLCPLTEVNCSRRPCLICKLNTQAIKKLQTQSIMYTNCCCCRVEILEKTSIRVRRL